MSAGRSVIPTAAAMEAEEDVLGAILSAASYDGGAGHRLFDLVAATGLVGEDFYRPSLGQVLEFLRGMRSTELPLDPVSVAFELERAGAEPHLLAVLHRLAQQVTAFSLGPRLAEIVREDACARRTGT